MGAFQQREDWTQSDKGLKGLKKEDLHGAMQRREYMGD